MTTDIQELCDLRRPRLLMQAARHGAAALKRAGFKRPSGVSGSLTRLLSDEAELDAQRRDGEANYSPRRHIDLLCALLLLAETARAI